MESHSLLRWMGLLTLAGAGVPVLLAAAGSTGALRPAFGQGEGANWRLAEPVSYETLTIFPVVSPQSADTSGFITLDEGLSSGEVVVSEQGADMIRRNRDGAPVPQYQYQSASVNQLVLINRSKRPLLLLAGELVSGGKQDRIIAKDRIVAPGAPPLPLDVFCVEHGRWSNGVQFSAGNMMVHPSVREAAALDQAQQQVWNAVRSGTTATTAGVAGGASSDAATPGRVVVGEAPLSEARIQTEIAAAAPTQAYQKIYNSPATAAPINSYADEVQRRFAKAVEGLKGERVIGVVVAYGGEVAWADVFASPELFERYWPKLVRSYCVEALARPQIRERATIEDARDFLKPLTGRETAETEPGAYRWRSVSEGHYSEISLDALKPNTPDLHWLKVHRNT
jgi:hypothetical protein